MLGAMGGPVASLRRYAPLIVAEVYLAITVAIFTLGPWPWPVEDGTDLYLFLVAAHGCLAAGYIAAARAPQAPAGWSRAPAGIVTAGSILILLLAWPTVEQWAGGVGFIDAVVTAWRDPVTMYRAAAEFESTKGTTPWVTYARTLSAPLVLAVLPLVVVYWRQLTRHVRILAVSASLVQFATVITSGRNKGLADTLIVLSSCWAIVTLREGRGHRLWRKAAAILAIGVMVLAFATFFERGSAGRAGPAGDRSRFRFLGMAADYDHPLIKVLPQAGQDGTLSMMGYLSIGY